MRANISSFALSSLKVGRVSFPHVEYDRCRLISRNNNEFKSFDSLNTCIAHEVKGHSVVRDGEIVCLDENGKPRFYDLLLRRGEPRFCAFDVLYCDGENFRYMPLAERKWRLPSLIPESSDRLFFCDHVEQYGQTFFQTICENDLEGIVTKRKFDPYMPDTKWFKIRNKNYSQWEGRHELFERERKADPDQVMWGSCLAACENTYDL